MFRETLKQCQDSRPLGDIVDAYESRRKEIEGFFYDPSGAPRADLCTVRQDCPVCRSDRITDADSYAGWPMCQCGECSTRFAKLLPTDDTLRDFFAMSDAERAFVTNVLHRKADARSATITSPRAAAIEKLNPQGGRILDVGCGSGDFLTQLNAEKWTTHGIDLSETAVEVSNERGVDHATVGTIFDLDDLTQYDCITFFGVMCRLDQHIRVFEKAFGLVRPGGYIAISDVNHDSWFSRLAGERTSKLVPPLHPILLGVDSIKRALTEAGFRVTEAGTPGRFDTVEVYRQAREGRMRSVPAAVLELLDLEHAADSMAIQNLLVNQQASEHMWIVAQRPEPAQP